MKKIEKLFLLLFLVPLLIILFWYFLHWSNWDIYTLLIFSILTILFLIEYNLLKLSNPQNTKKKNIFKWIWNTFLFLLIILGLNILAAISWLLFFVFLSFYPVSFKIISILLFFWSIFIYYFASNAFYKEFIKALKTFTNINLLKYIKIFYFLIIIWIFLSWVISGINLSQTNIHQ